MLDIKRLAAAACIGLLATPVLAQEITVDSRIAELRALSKDDRNAALRAMSQDERRGLWFQLKQAERADKGRTSTADGFYRDAVAQGAGTRGSAPRAAGSRAVGTIQYDDGVVTTSFGGGSIVGNRFDTHTGGVNVTASGTLDTIVAVVVEGATVTTSSAGFVMLGPQTVGGGAMAIFSTFTGAAGTTDTVTFSGIGVSYSGSSFYVLFGDFANSYVPAMGSGTNNMQGHHGVVGYTGGMGPNITSTFDLGGSLNGLIRATGNILPVELVEYGVD